MEQNPSRRDALKTLGAVPIAAGSRRLRNLLPQDRTFARCRANLS